MKSNLVPPLVHKYVVLPAFYGAWLVAPGLAVNVVVTFFVAIFHGVLLAVDNGAEEGGGGWNSGRCD